MLSKNDWIFLSEVLNFSITEKELIKSCQEDNRDDARAGVYADYLEENGRNESAKIVRVGYIQGIRDEKYLITFSGALPLGYQGTLSSGLV